MNKALNDPGLCSHLIEKTVPKVTRSIIGEGLETQCKMRPESCVKFIREDNSDIFNFPLKLSKRPEVLDQIIAY